MSEGRLLLLAGTAEGRRLAEALQARLPGRVIVSLAGRTTVPETLTGTVRVGGFGGAQGLTAFIRDEGMFAVIDATHPFAATITANAWAAAQLAGRPYLRLERPAWTCPPGARWQIVPTLRHAAQALPPGAHAFLSIGRQELHLFGARTDCTGVARSIEPPEGAFGPNWTLVCARPPFSLEDEKSLMRRHAITHLVTKNAGSDVLWGKLAAAEALDVAVVMVSRPESPVPAAQTVRSVDAAVAWVDGMV